MHSVDFTRNEQGNTIEIDHNFIIRKLIKKFMVQEDMEIVAKVLEPNALGVEKWMFQWALTKCIKLKVHSQLTIVRY